MEPEVQSVNPGQKESRYYTKYGHAHDHILRCKDCRKLVLHSGICANGGCTYCGNRKVTEVVALSAWEWFKIRFGIIDFPFKEEFLKEFSVRG